MVLQVESTLFKKGNDMRVTRKVLQERLDRLNIINMTDYALNEDHYCGGYCLTGGEVSLCGRRSGKEMASYLEAALDFSPLTREGK